MIRSPLGLRLNPAAPIKDQVREAARLGAKGVVIDAVGDIAPDRLSETGRRELRQMLRSVELTLIALHLPTRRPFDTIDQLDDRLRRAEAAFTLAYELGTTLVLARLGAVPPDTDAPRRETFLIALRELANRADHRGVRLGIETGTEPGSVLRPLLDQLDSNGLAASIDPVSLTQQRIDPAVAVRELGPWVVHAYANDFGATKGVAQPRGHDFSASAIDWEEYLGSLEEINYRGFLTVWPDSSREAGPQFTAMVERLRRF